jgi:hypothetical protein
MEHTHLLALALVLAWLAGLRVYLTALAVGLAGASGAVELPAQLQLLASPWVMGVAGLLTAVEFGADKLPGIDSGWDLAHTLLRVPVGAWLAGATLGDAETGLSLAGLAAGGGTALMSHGLKSATRALLNASPEPFSNAGASLGEDALALGGLLFALQNPWLVLGVLVLVGVLVFLLVFWLLRGLARWLGWRGRSTEPA